MRSENDQIEMDTLLRGLQLNRRTIREKQEEIDALQARIASARFDAATWKEAHSIAAENIKKLEAQLAAQAGQPEHVALSDARIIAMASDCGHPYPRADESFLIAFARAIRSAHADHIVDVNEMAPSIAQPLIAEAARDDVAGDARDAERFRFAISHDDNAEALYGAVLSYCPDPVNIRREIDAAIAASKEPQ